MKINLISISYFLNGFFPSILMFIYFFNNQNINASEIAILSSLIIVLLSIFSSNKRNLILSSNSKTLFYETLLFRVIFFLPILILYTIYLSFFEMLNVFNVLFFCLLFSLWINELLLVNNENSKDEKKIYFNILILIFYFFFVQFQFLLDFDFFNITNILLTTFLLFPVLKIFLKKEKNIFNINFESIKRSILNNIFSLSFISSFSFLLSVFIWRFFIIEFVGKEIAIYYFIIFAIASFPGTFINNFLGTSILKKNSKDFKKYFLTVLFAVLIAIILINNNNLGLNAFYQSQFMNNELLLMIINFSLVGTIIMSLAMFIRVNLFFLKNKINFLFISDFFYGLLIASIIPILCIFFNSYIYLSYFIGSIFSLVYYFSIYKICISLDK